MAGIGVQDTQSLHEFPELSRIDARTSIPDNYSPMDYPYFDINRQGKVTPTGCGNVQQSAINS